MAGDWTTSSAKWAAVLVLGGASLGALGWSLFGREVQPRPPLIQQRSAMAAVQERAPAEALEPAAAAPAAPQAPSAAPDLAAIEPTQFAEDRPPVPQLAQEPPAHPAVPPTLTPPESPAPTLTRTININTASAAELELLPGIGPALAARIIEHRTRISGFKSIDQLDDVRGIGPKTLEKLRPLVRVQ